MDKKWQVKNTLTVINVLTIMTIKCFSERIHLLPEYISKIFLWLPEFPRLLKQSSCAERKTDITVSYI